MINKQEDKPAKERGHTLKKIERQLDKDIRDTQVPKTGGDWRSRRFKRG